MLTWIWAAVVVLALIILIATIASMLSRLSGLRRAGERLRLRQTEAMRLRDSVEVLNRSVEIVQERAEEAQRRIVVIKAARGVD